LNHPVRVTEENAARIYTAGTQAIRWVKLALVALFALIAFESIASARGGSGMGAWLNVAVIVLVLTIPSAVLYLFAKK
jgi:hypothetical protein